MYVIYYPNGPVFKKPTLRDAKRYVERYTPLKRGWVGVWERTGPGNHCYNVLNSKGREIHNVFVFIDRSN